MDRMESRTNAESPGRGLGVGCRRITLTPFFSVLSENDFDLVGGDEKIVEIRTAQEVGPDDVRVGHWGALRQ
ncbi:MAG: hypothetical protein V2A58_13695 [Planctomycetota bacterium]